MAYTKLHQSILHSTVWAEDHATFKVWITLLVLANEHGEVEGTVPGLTRLAMVSRDECERALAKFAAPDPDSRTPDNDGRRIERIDGGWLLLNYQKYRAMASKEDSKSKTAERVRRHRERRRASNVTEGALQIGQSNAPVTQGRDIAEAEAEAESDHESVTTNHTGERESDARARKTKRPTKVDAGDFTPPPGRVNGKPPMPTFEGDIVPVDWKPTDATREKIVKANPKLATVKALQKELDAFRNWHRAKGIKVHDVEAGFAYWCRPKDDDDQPRSFNL